VIRVSAGAAPTRHAGGAGSAMPNRRITRRHAAAFLLRYRMHHLPDPSHSQLAAWSRADARPAGNRAPLNKRGCARKCACTRPTTRIAAEWRKPA